MEHSGGVCPASPSPKQQDAQQIRDLAQLSHHPRGERDSLRVDCVGRIMGRRPGCVEERGREI